MLSRRTRYCTEFSLGRQNMACREGSYKTQR